MDMVAYQPLLDQLIPLAREPDFEEIFARLTHEESRNTQFLLKMELKRKCSPCIRSIDMRARHPQSKAFQYGGVQHFLTDEAQEVFQTQLKIYRDHYTMGVYEAVIEDERLHRQQANADDGNSPPSSPADWMWRPFALPAITSDGRSACTSAPPCGCSWEIRPK